MTLNFKAILNAPLTNLWDFRVHPLFFFFFDFFLLSFFPFVFRLPPPVLGSDLNFKFIFYVFIVAGCVRRFLCVESSPLLILKCGFIYFVVVKRCTIEGEREGKLSAPKKVGRCRALSLVYYNCSLCCCCPRNIQI